MHVFWSLTLALTAAGCVSQAELSHPPSQTAAEPPLPVAHQTGTRLVATPYTVRSYRDPDDPTVLHDGHTVYRLTRVPDGAAAAGMLPRSAIASVTYAPLPPSAELAAELATQRQITAELRQIETSVIKTQQQALNEVGKLVDQKAEAVERQRKLSAGATRDSEAMPAGDSTPSAAAPPTAVNW